MANVLLPQVLWAQTDKVIYLTVVLADVKDEKIEFLPAAVKFTGTVDDKVYGFELPLHEEYDIENSRKSVTEQRVFLVLQKKEDALGFWPRLQKGQKPTYLKIDFSRWIEEDEEEEEPAQNFGGDGFPMGQDFSDVEEDSGDDLTPEREVEAEEDEAEKEAAVSN